MSEQDKKTYEIFEVRKWEKNGKSGVMLKPRYSKPTYKKGIKDITIELNDGTKLKIDSNSALFKADPEENTSYLLSNGHITEEQAQTVRDVVQKNQIVCYYTLKA